MPRPLEQARDAVRPGSPPGRTAASSLRELTDEELVRAAREEAGSGGAGGAGATAAFEELVARYERPLYGFLVVRVGNAADTEELVQEAFLRAWQKLDLYDSRWRFSTWLFTLAKRLGVSRARVLRPVALPEETLGRLADDTDPAVLAADREESSNVWKLAGRILSVEQRSALWLRYAEGLSNGEIGTILGKRTVSVRVLLFRAREALARALEETTARFAAREAASAACAEPARRTARTSLAMHPTGGPR
jgi:RNA polymerase sigma-70 factor (ECF subfamily)